MRENRVVDELTDRFRLRRKALESLQSKWDICNEKVRTKTRETADAPTYQVGERVGFRLPLKGNKLNKSYELHHIVVKVQSPSTYVIKNMKNGFERVVNTRKLRKIKPQTILPDPGNAGIDGVTMIADSDLSSSGDESGDDVDVSNNENAEDKDKMDPKPPTNPEGNWGSRLRNRDTLKAPNRLQL